jgi:hypothetical protein
MDLSQASPSALFYQTIKYVELSRERHFEWSFVFGVVFSFDSGVALRV